MMNPHLHRELVQFTQSERLAAAERRRRAAVPRPVPAWLARVLRRPAPAGPAPIAAAITIRWAFPDDHVAIARLAQLDCGEPPAGAVLVAEVDGELWAALSTNDGAVIADPFKRTAAVVELLAARAAQLRRSSDGDVRAGRYAERSIAAI